MSHYHLLRRFLLRSQPPTTAILRTFMSSLRVSHYTPTNLNKLPEETRKQRPDIIHGKWFTLPPFNSSISGSSLGKEISGIRNDDGKGEMTAVKWVVKCCPNLPRSLVEKLFRLRQVRRETFGTETEMNLIASKAQLKRVAAKDTVKLGDRFFLPITVQESPIQKPKLHKLVCNEEEISFIHDLQLYKDPAIIVVNKPHGMPVQGGVGIKKSLDELAASYLRFDYPEPPRLVHRLDRDSSGVLVMGRTQTSTAVLHSIFREKTSGAGNDVSGNRKRVLQRKYWALVIGCPKRQKGLISAPLGKVVIDNGKSERITIIRDTEIMPSYHALTEYRVIKPSCHGYTWLELSPLTGRKHQIRVHCAEVLGTPIVGDYKYGWQAHKNWEQICCPGNEKVKENLSTGNTIPLGLNLEEGSISGKQPRLHLHCKQLTLPNVAVALEKRLSCSEYDLSELESLEIVAPIPLHMQKSWDMLEYLAGTLVS